MAATVIGTTEVRELGAFAIGATQFKAFRRPELPVVWLRVRPADSVDYHDFGTVGDMDSRFPRPRIDPRWTGIGWGRPDVVANLLREVRDLYDGDEEARHG